jgi:hypothetical protein
MNSMVPKRYTNVNVMNSKGRYQEPFAVTTLILDHKYGHYVRPNMVALKYPNFKKDVNLDAHVRVFNFVVKVNVEIYKKYIINAFSYTLKYTTSDWCHNYMSEFPSYTFLELTQAFCKHHRKIQNDKQTYMELKNMK